VQTDTFALPPGYQAALELTLAENLAPSFGQTVARSTERRAREARSLIFGNNDSMRGLTRPTPAFQVGPVAAASTG